MIHLEELTVKNWCQFRGEHRFDLSGGLIGIYGPMGSGKSNIDSVFPTRTANVQATTMPTI
jgi:chromosome segregation ATPase